MSTTVITVTGNLAEDPEVRFTPTGRQVTRIRVIENRRRRTEDGTGWEDAEPNAFPVQVWGALGENVAESCHRGDRVTVTGPIVTDRWTDKDSGQQRTAQHITANDVAMSLQFHTAQMTKVQRASQQGPDDQQ